MFSFNISWVKKWGNKFSTANQDRLRWTCRWLKMYMKNSRNLWDFFLPHVQSSLTFRCQTEQISHSNASGFRNWPLCLVNLNIIFECAVAFLNLFQAFKGFMIPMSTPFQNHLLMTQNVSDIHSLGKSDFYFILFLWRAFSDFLC